MNYAAALDLLTATLASALTISQAMAKSRAENRDISKAELDQFAAADDAARERLEEAIGNAP